MSCRFDINKIIQAADALKGKSETIKDSLEAVDKNLIVAFIYDGVVLVVKAKVESTGQHFLKYETNQHLAMDYLVEVSKTHDLDFIKQSTAYINYIDVAGTPTGIKCEVFELLRGKQLVHDLLLRNYDPCYVPVDNVCPDPTPVFTGEILCVDNCPIGGKVFEFDSGGVFELEIIVDGAVMTTGADSIQLHRWSEEPNTDLFGREYVGELPYTGGTLSVTIDATYRWISVFARNPDNWYTPDVHDGVCFTVVEGKIYLKGFGND